jgi:hypothetical protein
MKSLKKKIKIFIKRILLSSIKARNYSKEQNIFSDALRKTGVSISVSINVKLMQLSVKVKSVNVSKVIKNVP